METTRRVHYKMNPAEDRIIFGDELEDGMWVLLEDTLLRWPGSFADEDDQLRGERFAQVTRLNRQGDLVKFIAEWVDGYQKVFSYHKSHAWLVKTITNNIDN